MQKTESANRQFYAQRGISPGNYGWTEAFITQYGRTSLSHRLELHVGNHLFRKRGGSSAAFLPDKFDYRHESLALSLGILREKDHIKGVFIGNYYEQTEEGIIRFRISEDSPSDILIIWEYDPDIYKSILQLSPTAISTAQNRQWFQAVFSLARENECEPNIELYDSYYDMEPDSADVFGSHWSDELSESEIASYRLYVCGF